jgi:2-polyprenyl-3-methyl-5-hydroxy-6-metoxy-1,4-benzoquinol methylase
VQKTPIADDSYHHVISWGVVEHDPNEPSEALQKFFRILRGGHAFVTTPVDSPLTIR